MVAESSAMVTTSLGNMLMALAAGHSNNGSIDNNLLDFKQDLFKELDAREKQAEQKVSEKLDEKYDALLRFLRGG
jgi:hypothetical protein